MQHMERRFAQGLICGHRNAAQGATQGRWMRLGLHALSAVLTLGAMAGGAAAQSTPNVVLSQSTLLGGLPNGGAFGSGTAAGVTLAVNQQGNVFVGTSYGGSLAMYNGATGAETTLGSYSNIGGVAVDLANNLYISNVYSSTLVKLPYVSGAYATFASPGASTPVCTGSDMAECTLPGSIVNGPYGVGSIVFDTKGDLFYASTNGGSAVDDAIFECNVACLASASPAPVKIFQEPTNASLQLLIGGMSADPSQNFFFTDSAFSNQSNEQSNASYVNELTYTGTGATGYSTTKKVLYTYTVGTPGNYDNEITSVNTDANGFVYFATEFDGVYGFANNKGVVNTATLYTFGTAGAKEMGTDGLGNFFTVNYSNSAGGDAVSHLGVGVLTVPQTNLGSMGTATNVLTIINDTLNCGTSTAVYAATEGGTPTTEFTAATSGSCSSANISGASAIPTTVTFVPNASGTRTATLTATDAKANTGSATVTGVGVGQPAATPTFLPAGGTYMSIQSVSIMDATASSTIYYTLDGTTPTTASSVYAGPITVATSETIKAIATAFGSGNSAVGSASYIITLPAATPTLSPAPGTYNAVQSVTISDTTPGATIYYTVDGSTPTTSSPVYKGAFNVSVSETVNAIATAPGYVTSAVGSATYAIKLPTFSLLLTPNPITVAAANGSGLVNVVVMPLNTFAGTVTFACAGLPTGATCSFAPSSVTPYSGNQATTVMSITTATRSSAVVNAASPMIFAAVLAAGLFGLRRRRLPRLLMVLVMAGALGLLAGCSGASSNTSGPVTTSTVTVTATSGTIVQTGTLTLTTQ